MYYLVEIKEISETEFQCVNIRTNEVEATFDNYIDAMGHQLMSLTYSY